MATVTVPISAGANDQLISRSGSSYNTGTITRSTTITAITAEKSLAGTYDQSNALLVFDTGAYLPDNAIVSSATLNLYKNAASNGNGRSLVGDYFIYAGTTADYDVTPVGNAVSATLASLVAASGWVSLSMTNLSGISATGSTSIRLGVSGATPTGLNYFQTRAYEWSPTGTFSAYLTINYTTNVAPTASFSVSGTGMSRTFTDTSTDPDGTIAYSWWRVGDGTADYQSTVPFAHSYANGGTYTVFHWVYDNSGALSNTATQSVVIAAPHADFSYTTSASVASFTDLSTPSSGQTITSRSWNFGDSATSTATNPTHTYSAAGTYTVTLTETGSNGFSGTVQKLVTVGPPAPNQPPVAYFTASTGALTVNFTDASSDPDNAIVSWAWNFGDAGTSTSQNPSHTYSTTGTYTVSLTVTDAIGATNTYSRSMTVRTAGTANSYVAGPIFLRESTLTADVDATQTTIPVAELAYWSPNGALWPNKNEGMLDPEGAAEKITWTAKSATHGPGNLTGVTRGAFGTTAASHTSGEIIGLYGRHDAGLKIKGKIPLSPANASLTLQELRRHFDSERFVWADFNNFNEQAQLEITGSPTSTGNVSTTLDEGGTAVTRNAGVTSAKEVRSLVIGASATSSGNVLVTLNSTLKSIAVTAGAGVTEQHQAVFAGFGHYSGDTIISYYNASNVLSTITISHSLATPEQVAANIRATSIPGWTLSGTSATVLATGTTAGQRGNTGAASDGGFWINKTSLCSQSVLREGVDGSTATGVANTIRVASFPGWVTGGTGTTVTFTALEPGVMTGTFSYNNNGTGATGTLSQTTAGTQSTPAQVATAIRAQYSGNTYWTPGGSGATVTWDALTSGPKQDATFSGGTTGTVGNMQTVHQGSADIVGHLTDSGGIEQTRRLLGNLATTTEYNLEASVSGAGTEHGIISFWGSFGTDPLTHLWRVEDLDLTEFPVEEGAYGVTSESASGLTWDVRTDEVELTDRGKTYYRDHNLAGQLLGQLHYFGLLEPEQASDDIGVQDLWHPVMPGQQISLAFYMRYENMPVAFPSQPLFISFYHADGTVTPVGDASGLIGLSGDADWAEYTTPTFSAPTLDENPVPAYWMRIQSKQMSSGTLVIQEINPSLGAVVTRTPYYAFEGTFRTQLDARTPKETPYLLLERERTGLEVQFEENGGVVTPQYRSASDPALFDGTWYTDASEVPDLPVIDADVTLSGDGLSTPEVPAGYPRMEYRARPSRRHLFLKGDRTELPGGVIMDKVADWYRKPGTAQVLLPSGHTFKQKLNEPVGYLPSFELWAFRPETVKYLLENLNAVGMLFYAEVFNELLLLKVLTPEPKFARASLSRFDNEDFGDTSAASRYSFWVSDALAAEVMDVTEISE